jgi:hypothetical protein
VPRYDILCYLCAPLISYEDTNVFQILQLLWSSFPGSLVSGVCGLIAGVLYRSETLSLKHWRVPNFLEKACVSYILPWLSSTSSTVASHDAGRRRSPQIGQQEMPVPEESIAALVSLGFERERAITALRASNLNVERAASSLLDTSS